MINLGIPIHFETYSFDTMKFYATFICVFIQVQVSTRTGHIILSAIYKLAAKLGL